MSKNLIVFETKDQADAARKLFDEMYNGARDYNTHFCSIGAALAGSAFDNIVIMPIHNMSAIGYQAFKEWRTFALMPCLTPDGKLVTL